MTDRIDTSTLGPIRQVAAASEPVHVRYVNYRGEESFRQIIPIRLTWGSTDWHPAPQWLLEAHDVGKGETRQLALGDCDFMPECPR